MGSVSVVFVFLGDALRHDAAALVRQGESETAKPATFQGWDILGLPGRLRPRGGRRRPPLRVI